MGSYLPSDKVENIRVDNNPVTRIASDERKSVFEKIAREIIKRRDNRNPFMVGISGIDLSGKTEFTRSLAEYLTAQQIQITVIHLDDFHNPRAFRNSGPDPIENYLQRNFNIDVIIRDLLVPLRRGSGFSLDLTLLDLNSDKYDLKRRFTFEQDTVVLFEGVFLFRKELAPFLDYKIFLDISYEESRRRALIRDVPVYGENMLHRYIEKYWPAQMKYLAEYPTLKTADLIIDNNVWEHPVIKFER
jgi:uridine kinase